MLHACFYTICLVFCYTSWHFYAFSGTNLLTSRHSASSLFSAVFVFQKIYTGNILGIGRNQSQSSRISPKLAENRRGDGVGPRGPHTTGRRGQGPGRAPYVWGRLGPLLTMPDEGTTNGPPIFAYLVFGPGRVSRERLLKPIKAVAWRGLGAILGVQARFRGVQVRLDFGRSDLYLAWETLLRPSLDL
jgi:hypothetical protein